MGLWNKAVWWISGFVVLACLLALTQTAQTSSGAAHSTGSSTSSSDPAYFTVEGDSHAGVGYGVTENGRTVIYNRSPSDP
jgi:hypothetical protein